MALSVVGKLALWLNLSGLPNNKKRCIAGGQVEPGQALFGPDVALMQQRCNDKKEDEAFKLWLPRKDAPHQPPSWPLQVPATGRPYQNYARTKARSRPPNQQPNQPSKPLFKMSFAVAAANQIYPFGWEEEEPYLMVNFRGFSVQVSGLPAHCTQV